MLSILRYGLKVFCCAGALLIFASGCDMVKPVARKDFASTLTALCQKKYQAAVVCKPLHDTVWVYLPYVPGRKGSAVSEQRESDLYLEYEIESFNPYKVIDPPELKYLAQKVLGEIRGLLLRSADPYKFFVLVVTDITQKDGDPAAREEWYMGHYADVKKYKVGADFSGEGYSRLAWQQENIPADRKIYMDGTGEHLNYREIALREFIERQIKWRIYKRFTIEYNTVPFDISYREKEEAVLGVINTVLKAYNFKEFKTFYLHDASNVSDAKEFTGFTPENAARRGREAIGRRPAF